MAIEHRRSREIRENFSRIREQREFEEKFSRISLRAGGTNRVLMGL